MRARTVRLGLLAAAAALLGPSAIAVVAAEPVAPTRCADPAAVSRVGDWEAVRAPAFALRTGGRGAEVAAFAVHPALPQVRFATNGTSVERTDDGGCSWREVYALPDVPSESDGLAVATSEVVELVVPQDPRGDDRLLLVAREGDGGPRVLASEDGGVLEPFRDRSEGLPPTGAPRDLLVAPTNPEFLFLGVETGPAAADTGPGGALPVPLPLPELPELPLGGAGSPTSPGALYGSVDGGLTWEPRVDLADLGTSTAGVDRLAGHPSSPNRLWAVADGVLRASTDGGRTFAAPQPSPQEQRDRGWDVTAVTVQRLPGRPSSPAPTLVWAFSATSVQGGGPVLLLSRDGGESYDEQPLPGVVDAAAPFLPGTGQVVVSTRPQGDVPAEVLLLGPGDDEVSAAPIGPGVAGTSLAVTADLSQAPTFHARTATALLRYTGPAAVLPDALPPVVGGAVPDLLPPLGPAALSPSRDAVRLPVGGSVTVEHALLPPRRPAPLDLYLLLDTSESMADDLPRVVDDLVAMTRGVREAGVDLSVGLGEFKGGESAVAYRRVRGVGSSPEDLRAGLDELRADGFGLEAQLIALEQALAGAGESAAALLPAPCKVTPSDPDRFVTDERRTAPPVLAGQQADFRRGSVPVVLVVTDTNFLRPAGTPLKPDCSVDVESVAARYAAAGVAVVGLGVDDVADPARAADLLLLARATGAVQPPGTACAPGIDPAPGGAAVCRRAVDLVPALAGLAARPGEPAQLQVVTDGSPVLAAVPASLSADLRRATPVALPVTYRCAEAGRFAAEVTVRLQDELVAVLTADVVCDAPPAALPLPPAAVAAVPLAGLLPPPAPVPPPPAPPAQAVQPQPQLQTQAQAQAQAQTGAQEQQRTAAELALALQQDTEQEQLRTVPMSARAAPDVVRLTALALLTAAAAGAALRSRPTPVRARSRGR